MRSQQTVLVMEDDIDVAFAAKRRLESAGYQVLTSRNGAEGIGVAVGSQPQVIVLGDSVQRLSDVSALHFLSEHPQTKHIPILRISSDDAPACREFAKLSRPYEGTQLLDTVARAMRYVRGNEETGRKTFVRIETAHVDKKVGSPIGCLQRFSGSRKNKHA